MSDQPSFSDAIGSFVDQSVRLAAAERENARLREVLKSVTALARRWEKAEADWPTAMDRAFGATLLEIVTEKKTEKGEADVPDVR